jgi:outer membrane biosynthesis protein TonB
MRRFIAGSLASLLIAAATAAPAVADGELSTIKADTAAFTDLTTRASSGSLDLGARERGDGPVVEETMALAPQRLSSKQVQTVVAQKSDDIRYCYDRAMRGVKDPTSEIAVSFVILPRGNVAKIKVTSVGGPAKALEKCIVQRVKKWRFPVADAETEVEIPFVFGTM